ncbi:MAG: tetratricopeptide repeat protein [Treponema sp.]|nr:tetratricopeptide repeat protein [Treponema sp.]
MFPDKNVLRQAYEQYSDIRALIIKDLEIRIEKTVSSLSSHPTVKGRVKEFNSFFKKYLRILKNDPPDSGPPLITDLMGIRIVCPFIEDIAGVEELIKKSFEITEVERKGAHYSFKEFGYESTHLLIKIPQDIVKKRGKMDCDVVEIQIRTILQNAWAEVEHELVYKAEFTPFDEPMKRKLAAVNASLFLADIVFQEIRAYQRQLNAELDKRRETFFQKIEESTDALLFSAEQTAEKEKSKGVVFLSESIDDLLLNALYAHNKNQFDDAIAFYSRILELNPDNTVSSLIYKHRGMANFARSKYQDAIDDFTHALELDKTAYKAAYYRGVVQAVLKQYSGAIDDFTHSLKIHPYQPFCLFRRSQAYYHIEDYPQALSDCEASLALEPENEAVRKLQQILLEKLKM